MKNLKELEQKYLELGKEIEALKNQVTDKKEITYPVYCKSIGSSLVVKFTGLQEGKLVVNSKHIKIEKAFNEWRICTDTNTWQRLDVCEETGFFDGQLIWCWDNDETHSRHLRFYDVRNKCAFYDDGKRNGYSYKNYEPFEGNYPDWALEAFQTLER